MLPDLSLDDIAAALSVLDPSCAREDWVKVGTALKSEYGDAGFAVFDDWSAGGGNYDANSIRSVWKSLRPGKVGLGWLINVAKARGHKFRREDITREERAARREAQRQRRAEIEAQVLADEAALFEWQERVAIVCEAIERDHLSDMGQSEYLQRKKVGAYGLGFVRHGVVVLTHITKRRIELISGKDNITAFFERRGAGEIDPETTSFRYLKYGTVAVPMRDMDGYLWGYQFVNAQGSKQFLKFGRKQGLHHMITSPGASAPETLFAAAEGYATGASVHQATGWPVAIAFDAGNLVPVCRGLRERYPDAQAIVCGDDDHATEGNPGRTKAQAAAQAIDGLAVWPSFETEAVA